MAVTPDPVVAVAELQELQEDAARGTEMIRDRAKQAGLDIGIGATGQQSAKQREAGFRRRWRQDFASPYEIRVDSRRLQQFAATLAAQMCFLLQCGRLPSTLAP